MRQAALDDSAARTDLLTQADTFFAKSLGGVGK